MEQPLIALRLWALVVITSVFIARGFAVKCKLGERKGHNSALTLHNVLALKPK